MNILFACKHNRLRSKVAEALFRKYNKNKKIKVKSRAANRTRLYPCC
jgi:protein-tyrosine-phosphatase